jgi:hypothetical protein
MFVAVILISSVMMTYQSIRYGSNMDEPQILSAIDETNLALKQVLGFTVGYYGSVLQVTGNSSYARSLADRYLMSGLQNVADIRPEWGASFHVTGLDLSNNWFMNQSFSRGILNVTYALTGLQVSGIAYSASLGLSVNIFPSSLSNKVCLNVTLDGNSPINNLGLQNFQFYRYRYNNLTWVMESPTSEPIAFSNGTYLIDIPMDDSTNPPTPKINPYAYLIQVKDTRGITVAASSYSKYTSTLTFNSTYVNDADYVDDYTSDVDNFTNLGSHTAFGAQQSSTDGLSDTLTEGISGTVPNDYSPDSYNPLSAVLVSGSPSNLANDDGSSITFGSQSSSTSAQELYTHLETTSIAGQNYYTLMYGSANAAGTTIVQPMTNNRVLLAKSVFSLQGVTSIPSSTWNLTYRAWKDPTINGNLVNNATSTSGGWTNPANAYADGGSYASSTAAGDRQIYGGYGFAVPANATGLQVRVRLDAFCPSGDDDVLLEASIDGGLTWLPSSSNYNLPSSDPNNYFINITSWSAWTPANVNGGNLVVRLTHVGVSSPNEVRLDWIPIEVSYVTPCALTDDPTSSSGSWSNPANAHTDDGGVASSSTDGNQQVYNGYGFSIPANATVTQVRIRVDAYRSGGDGNDQLLVGASDGSWLSTTSTLSLTTTQATYWVDITAWSASGWTLADLNSLVVRVCHVRVGASTDILSLDWLPVEVTYTSPTVDPNYPSSNSAGWSNAANANANGEGVASSTNDGEQQVYTGYGFSLPSGAPITQVRIRVDAYRSGGDNNDQLQIGASNGTWFGTTSTLSLTTSESTQWVDITGWSASGWTTTDLDNLAVRVSHYPVGSQTDTLSLDWLPVEVTYTSPTVDPNYPSSNSAGWTNPTNAYTDGSGSAYSTKDGDQQVYSGFGFSLSGVTITQVRARVDAWVSSGDDQLLIGASDGDWLETTSTLNLTTSQTTQWIDITSWSASGWTPAELLDVALRVNHVRVGGSTDQINLDYVLVEVTYYANVVDTNDASSYDTGTWSNPTRAYSNDYDYASSSTNGAYQPYRGYSYSLPSNAVVLQVRVRMDAWCPYGDDDIKLEVSTNGGSSWLAASHTQSVSTSQTTYWIDVTSWATWTYLLVNNINTRVTYVQVGGSANQVRLDYIPVEVTYYVPTPSTTSKAPSFNFDDWTNPTYAYADAGGYAYSTTDGTQQVYSNFGFVVPSGSAVTQVRVRLDAYRSGGDGNDEILIGVSNGTWLSTTHEQSLTTSEATYWIDVTGWTAWTQAGANGIAVRVAHVRNGVSTDEVRLDCIQVEVTFGTESVATNSPSTNSAGWSNPNNAHGDSGGYASSTIDGSQQVYNGYGFSLPGNALITQVRVRLDAYRSGGDGNDDVLLGVSYGSWSTVTQEQELTGSEATYWIDVTGWATWTPAGVNSIATRIVHMRYGLSSDEVRLDCIQVEVTFSLPTALTNSPSSNSAGWINPANAYADGGSYASSTIDGTQQVYGGYSFSVPSNATITQVRIRLDAYRVSGGDNNDRILLGVSNGNWQGNTTEVTLGSSESTIWVDVTGYASWTPANINNIQQRFSHVRYGGSTEELRLDYIQFEVTYSIPATFTNSPTSNSCWTNPTNAYLDAGSYSASTGNSDRQTYGGYNFSLPLGSSVSMVRVRLDAWCPTGDDDVLLEVSVDGGATWLATTHTYNNLPASDPNNYYVDVTSWTTWTLAKLNNDSVRARVTHVASGETMEEVRLDWIPMEVTYSVVTTAHLTADVLIRNADGTVNATIATGAAPSQDLTSAQQTLWGTYAFPGRTITSQNAYLEIDYYAEVSNNCSLKAYLRLDDNTLSNSSQTRLENLIMPNEQACTFELYGPSNTNNWNYLLWNMSSFASTSDVRVSYQLYNNNTQQYPSSGYGYMNTTLGTTESATEGWVNASATDFRDAIGRWSLKVTAVKGTSSPFNFTMDMAKFRPGSATYALDLEEDWSSLNFTMFQPTLCIKTGNLSGESLAVDFWNATGGAHWQNIFTGLTPNGWNNKSIAITPPMLTIRFRNNDAFDYSPNSWQLDAVLIRSSSHQELFQSLPGSVVTLELMQNGTMRWLGQDTKLMDLGGDYIQGIPIPPVPVKDIHVTQTTIDGDTSEVPFQIEDWGSNYQVPLGLTNNETVFGNRQMIVSLMTTRLSQITVWWNGSDSATQTPLAYTNQYFQNDNTESDTLSNGLLNLKIDQVYDSVDHATVFKVTSTVGDSRSVSKFMRINGDNSTYGAAPAYVIHHGIVRDIVQQEAEWSNGIPDCPNVYSNVVLTLPANATYFTYQQRLMFMGSAQPRTITDLCPIKVQSLVNGVALQTENGLMQSDPIVSNASGTFIDTDIPGWTGHHWSQLINNTGAGAGIMFTDAANLKLYTFDGLAGTSTGGLRVNNSTRTLELLPVSGPSVSFQTPMDITWYGAVVTFSSAVYANTGTPIYKPLGLINSGHWILAELPPTITVTTGN